MKKKAVIEAIKKTYDTLDEQLHYLKQNQMMQEQFNEEWKVKDVIGHILWYEEEIHQMLKNKSFEGNSPIWDNELHERNALIYEEMEGIDVSELMDRHDKIYPKIIEVLQDMSDEDMVNPENYEGMPTDWTPWQIIAGSTYAHYKEHSEKLAEFIESNNSL